MFQAANSDLSIGSKVKLERGNYLHVNRFRVDMHVNFKQTLKAGYEYERRALYLGKILYIAEEAGKLKCSITVPAHLYP
jgi:hypothetical protein